MSDSRVADLLESILSSKLTKLAEKVNKATQPLIAQIDLLKNENIQLNSRVEELERYSRTSNLIIHGLPYVDHADMASASTAGFGATGSQSAIPPRTANSSQSAIKAVQSFCHNSLKIDVKSSLYTAHRTQRLSVRIPMILDRIQLRLRSLFVLTRGLQGTLSITPGYL